MKKIFGYFVFCVCFVVFCAFGTCGKKAGDKITLYEQLITQDPVNLKLYDKLVGEYELRGDLKNAFAIYQKAMYINPNFIEARFHEEKDPERFDVSGLNLPETCLPWKGEALQGKKIFVYVEKGLGDTIQGCRFLPFLTSQSQAAHVFFKPQNALFDLMCDANLNVEVLDAKYDLSSIEADYYVSLLSLPHLLNVEFDQIPAKDGYLRANAGKVAEFKKKFFDNNCLKIGIVWQGDPNNKNDKNRSIKLSELYSMAKVPGVKVYSLQKVFGLDQLKDLPSGVDIINMDDVIKDFADTAAIIENLDIFVGVDSAIIHLSGALNKKSILMLSDSVDGRWLINCKQGSNLWYNSVKAFRQKKTGDWSNVVSNLVAEIQDLVKK